MALTSFASLSPLHRDVWKKTFTSKFNPNIFNWATPEKVEDLSAEQCMRLAARLAEHNRVLADVAHIEPADYGRMWRVFCQGNLEQNLQPCAIMMEPF